jgi:hypothetical protein
MGFLKDARNLAKQGKEMLPPEHRGVAGGFRAMKDGMATMSETMGDMQATAAKAQRLNQVGRIGTATVMALRDTGMTINEDPQVELDLQVTLEGVSPYLVTHRQVISRLAVAGFQPGATVPVRVDPEDLQSLIVA